MAEMTKPSSERPPDRGALEYLVDIGRVIGGGWGTGPGGDPYTIIPQGMKLESLAHLAPPNKVKATPMFRDVASFAGYVNRFKDGGSVLFANVTDSSASFTCILDYHKSTVTLGEPVTLDGAPVIPRRCAHVARLELEPTREWQDWTKANGSKMSQVEFAAWLEDRVPLFTSPSGAELLELILDLEGKQEVRFSSGMRLNNGKNALAYDEDVALRGGTVNGKIEVPEVVTVSIQPFHGAAAITITARLRYRIESRRLTLWLDSIRLHQAVRDAVKVLVAQVQEQTGLTALLGTP